MADATPSIQQYIIDTKGIVQASQANPDQFQIMQQQLAQITWFTQFLGNNPNLVTAAKTVNNFDADQDAWGAIWDGIGGYNPTNSKVQTYANGVMEQYYKVSGRKAAWNEQVKVASGTGRMPTILTSGRGVRGGPTLALSKLKKQLGK